MTTTEHHHAAPRTWDSGNSRGEERRRRLALYGVNRDAEELESLPYRDFENQLCAARDSWHVAEAKRQALRLGSSASLEEIAPALVVMA